MAAKGKGEKDELTGLQNYSAFLGRLRGEIQRSDREGEELTLAFLDIDNFKFLNDHLGHEAGDEIIRFTARHVADSLGSRGEVFRYGGEEFAVLLPGVEREEALLLLDKVRKDFDLVREIETESGKEVREVTFSAGLASYPADGSTDRHLIGKADDAMYRAKATGRNKVCLSREEKMVTKTSHYTQGQLQRLARLSEKEGVGEALLLREALDELLRKYDHLSPRDRR